MSQQQLTISKTFAQKSVQKRFHDLLGAKSQGFITSVLQAVQSNKLLKEASPESVLNAAATAAAMDLPVNQNLGFSWIVPYKIKDRGVIAQFQIGWKGLVQLAHRTQQYEKINAIEVYDSQFVSFNALTEELKADFSVPPNGKVVGYAAYFMLLNGFIKTDYWPVERVMEHAKKYSKSFAGKGDSPWKDPDQIHAMAKKTVLKNIMSKYGVLSMEMQDAILADQAEVTEDGDFKYVDNEPLSLDERNAEEEANRIKKFIQEADTLQKLDEAVNGLPKALQKKFSKEIAARKTELQVPQ